MRIIIVKADKQRGWIALLSPKSDLDPKEIIRLYGKRWDIEVFFKMCKQQLKMVKGIQIRNFDGLIAHTTIVFVRYNILSYHQRINNDLRSYRDVFRFLFDKLANLSFIDALSRILSLEMDELRKTTIFNDKLVD